MANDLGGAPLGNQNAAKGARWRKALERVLARKYGDVDAGLEKLAEAFVEAHLEPKLTSEVCRDIADRFDGKPKQQISGDPDAPLVHRIERVLIDGSTSKDA